MARIIESTEEHGLDRIRPLGTKPAHRRAARSPAAAAEIGELLGAKYLVTFTQSGDSAKRLSRHPPRLPMLAFTPDQRDPLASSRSPGASRPSSCRWPGTPTRWRTQVDEALLRVRPRASRATRVVIVAGSPPGIPGSTNALRVHRIGDAVNKVAPAYEDLDDPTIGS